MQRRVIRFILEKLSSYLANCKKNMQKKKKKKKGENVLWMNGNMHPFDYVVHMMCSKIMQFVLNVEYC